MNINLLPQKFVKNRATDMIIWVTGITSITVLLLFIGVYFFLTMRLNQVTVKEQQVTIEKIGLEKKVAGLEKEQSVDIQSFLKELKSDRYLISPVMATFEKTASKLGLKVLNYQIVSKVTEEQDNSVVKAANGEELFAPIKIRLQGDLFERTPKFKKELEKNDWVYDVMPVNAANESSKTEFEFIVRIKKNLVEEQTSEKGDQ